MFRKIREAQKNEEGFTLIELLVVVIIIGILAAIAIPVFMNQRRSAWVASVESDLRNVAVEMEASATTAGGDYPLAVPAYAASDNVTVTYSSGTVNEYCLIGTHSSDATISVVYDSDDGGLADNTAGC